MIKNESEAERCFEKKYKNWDGSECSYCMFEEFCWKLLAIKKSEGGEEK